MGYPIVPPQLFEYLGYSPNLIQTMLSNSTPIGIASASSEYSSTYYAYRAFNNDVNTMWQSTVAGKVPSWLQYEFSTAYAITRYTLVCGVGAPKSWTFEAYNGSTWDVLDTHSGITGWGVSVPRTYSFTNTTAYTKYRVYITECQDTSTTTIIRDIFMYTSVSQDTNIQIGDVSLQADINFIKACVAGLSLQTEIGIPDIQVADVSLQVEVYIPTEVPITSHTVKIEILQYTGTGEIDSIPDIGSMVLTADHGLSVDDFFVNKTARDSEDWDSSERASRKVLLVPSTTEIQYDKDIASASVGDEILLFKFTDVTQYLIEKTLNVNLKADHNNTASFRLFTPIVDDVPTLQFYPGQYVRISLDDEVRFLGIIASSKPMAVNEIHPYLYQDINCIGLKGLAARRTVTIDFADDTTAGEIVTALIENILVQEGLNLGSATYISDGQEIGERWTNDCVSVSDIIDECASRNGFQWFIDNEWNLNFYQDPDTVEDAPYDIDESGIIRYRNLDVDRTLDGYINKVFVIGGKDFDGNQIQTVNIDVAKANAMQELCGGSGVYGNILRDSTLSTAVIRTAEAGTAFFTIVLTGHGLSVGDYIWNDTLGQAFWVASIIGDNSFTVNETDNDQAENDIIITYPANDDAGLNMIKKQGIIPKTVSYTIDHIFMDPQMKQKISLPRSGVPEGYYNVESVQIKAVGAGYYESRVTAILRDENDFSTQHHASYADYFRAFLGTSKRTGYGPNFGALNKAHHVGDTAPSDPKDRDTWFDNSASPGTLKYYDEATTTWKT